jgi:putative ABC transport system permease protein
MASLLRDARFAVRLLWRTPGFTAIAATTLALGIGATTAIFSVVYGLFFAPLPYHKADRLVMVWEQEDGERRYPPPSSYIVWKREATAFADVNAWGGGPVNIATPDRPENLPAGRATPGFLPMLGYGHPLALGRTFTEDEGIVGNDKVVVLTYRLWQDRFGGDRAIVGRTVRVDDQPHTVIGVLGEGPADHQQSKIWLPLALTDEQLTSGRGLSVMARLKDGVGLAEANASMKAVAAAVEKARRTPRRARTVSVEPFRNNFVQASTKRGIWLLLGAVGFLLLIACANVANLLLTRGTARRRELAIRTAIGASRGAVMRQLIVESVVVALAGGVLGTLLALGVIDAVVALMPAYTLPSETEVTLSVPVLLFACATCAAAGLLAGLAPAWRASRAGVAEVIKESGRSVGAGRDRLRRALIVIEFALALTLLAGGGMALHALAKLMRAELGLRAEHLVTFSLTVPRDRLATDGAREAFYRAFLERAEAVPGVASVAVSTGLPVGGYGFGTDFEIEGRPNPDPDNRPGGGVNMVTPDFYRTFGIRTVAGRVFDDRDRAGSTRVAVVNETFVRLFLPDENPIGRRVFFRPFTIEPGPRPEPVAWEIVGVHGDVANNGPGRRTFPSIDVPFWQMPWPSTRVAVRTRGSDANVVASLTDVVQALDPTLPVSNVRTIEQIQSEYAASDRFYTVFFAAFAAVALILAAVGIYGVMSFAVAQRTHEIGLRMALGARRGQVLAQMLREGMGTALLGTAIGGIGAALIGRLLQGTVHGVDATNPLTFAAVAALLLAAALVACFLPARRAATIDPMVALRQD